MTTMLVRSTAYRGSGDEDSRIEAEDQRASYYELMETLRGAEVSVCPPPDEPVPDMYFIGPARKLPGGPSITLEYYPNSDHAARWMLRAWWDANF